MCLILLLLSSPTLGRPVTKIWSNCSKVRTPENKKGHIFWGCFLRSYSSTLLREEGSARTCVLEQGEVRASSGHLQLLLFGGTVLHCVPDPGEVTRLCSDSAVFLLTIC